MGGSGTKLVKKVTSPVSSYSSYFWGTGREPETETQPPSAADLACCRLPPGVSIYVMKRRGSMYFDEDGDLAHEFYEEQYNRHRQEFIMKRKKWNLRPQGEVSLPIPRLNNNLPFVLCEAPS